MGCPTAMTITMAITTASRTSTTGTATHHHSNDEALLAGADGGVLGSAAGGVGGGDGATTATETTRREVEVTANPRAVIVLSELENVSSLNDVATAGCAERRGVGRGEQARV